MRRFVFIAALLLPALALAGPTPVTISEQPVQVVGTFTSSGPGNTIGSTVALNGNSVCATVWLAGQPGAALDLAAGTLATTLTPAVSADATQSGNGCTGGTWTSTAFIDYITGNSSSTLVTTNPNAGALMAVREGPAVCARVCTAASGTTGSASAFLLATQTKATTSAGSDVTDRAGRLLGVTYGSQGQQLQQTATNFNLRTEAAVGGTLIDPRAIRALTTSDAITASQGGSWTVGLTGTVPLPTGAATSALQLTLNSLLPGALDGTGGLKTHEQGTVAVTGTFFQGTQPVSAAVLPLPTGAATAAKQPALGTAGAASSDVLSVQGVASMTPLKTDSSATTQPISASALPLPSGASTAAKQAALGTAGSPSADVITVQGATSMTALKTDASATTQPISATALPLPTGAATDASLTGGTQRTKLTDGTTNAAVKAASTAAGATDPALVVAISPNNTIAATESGTWTVQPGNTPNTTAWKVDNSAVTQPGSSAIQDPAFLAPGSTSAPSKAPVVMGKTADGTPQYVPLPLAAGGGSVIVSGTLSSAGAADAVSTGAPTTFNANAVCTGALLLAGQQSAGFQLNSGTLAATLTASYSMEASGTNFTTTTFASGSTIVVTNPNALIQTQINLVGGARRVQVCTTAYTLGSATGFATATFVQSASSLGTVAVSSLPALPAGTNVIGHMIADSGSTTAVTSLPSTPAGTNLIGKVGIDQTTPGTTNGVQINAALPAGTNIIGHTINDTGSTTAVTSLPALPAGSNTIGAVTGPSAAALALDASVTGLEVAQGSTTSGQKGILGLAAVSTSAPTLTNGQSSPPSMDTSGNLRMVWSGTGNMQGLGTAGAPSGGVLTVQPPSSGSTTFPISGSLTPADTAGTLVSLSTACSTGVSCAAGSTAVVQLAGQNSANITFSTGSTPLMTVVADCAGDGGTAYGLTGSPSTTGLVWFRKTDGTLSQSIANPGNLTYNMVLPQVCSGATTARVRAAAVTSGTVNGQARAAANAQASYAGAIGANSYPPDAVALMAQDSSTATTSRAVKATANGVQVDTGAVVTAASTAPVTGSAALTIVESPNSLGCAGQKITTTNFKPVSITTGTQLITGTASQNVYICSIDLVVSAADNVALVEGTGTVCATGTAGMAGGTTAAAGWNFTANGGITKGDGFHAQFKTATQADNVCLLVSGAAQVSGSMTWVSF